MDADKVEVAERTGEWKQTAPQTKPDLGCSAIFVGTHSTMNPRSSKKTRMKSLSVYMMFFYVENPHNRRKKNVALGYLITYILEKKYNLIHPKLLNELPVYFIDASFCALFGWDQSSEGEDSKEKGGTPAPIPTPGPDQNFYQEMQWFCSTMENLPLKLSDPGEFLVTLLDPRLSLIFDISFDSPIVPGWVSFQDETTISPISNDEVPISVPQAGISPLIDDIGNVNMGNPLNIINLIYVEPSPFEGSILKENYNGY
ncbi:hypothetical protein IEQ34_009430 [Dendrobium chrysotoxum]|uniref:Uncharacterized protein n=1 Tax=Dendrobium chrysotoxum TaxID=161865 RepID=A0AAV7H2V5_DENCH|nr:hypothetical protein IEQ34_009430 [Dendrobium chrysotoxum]